MVVNEGIVMFALILNFGQTVIFALAMVIFTLNRRNRNGGD